MEPVDDPAVVHVQLEEPEIGVNAEVQGLVGRNVIMLEPGSLGRLGVGLSPFDETSGMCHR
jgi:hypothetical protein